jgi:hypothetical protein
MHPHQGSDLLPRPGLAGSEQIHHLHPLIPLHVFFGFQQPV